MMLAVDVAAGALVLGLLTYGLIAVCQMGLDEVADRRGWSIPDPDEDMEWTDRIHRGRPLSREVLRRVGRYLRETRRPVVPSARRHGGGSS